MLSTRVSFSLPGKMRGVSMIEALIAMAVLSIGLFGVLGLQAKAMQFSYASFQRSQASIQAKDLVERLWTGVCALPAASDDIRDEWIAAHQGSLPNWTGTLTFVPAAGAADPRYDIVINWTDTRLKYTAADVSQQAQSFSYTTRIPQLPCS